jgi:hypothetical protein
MRMARHIQRRSPDKLHRAQALAEFALVLPILLIIIFGVIDFGWIIFNYSQLYNGLREGLRYGSVPGYEEVPQYYQCDTIRNRITTLANMSGIQASDINIYYDDGRPFTGATDANTVGDCNGSSFSKNTGYVDIGGTAYTSGRELQIGDRIFIDINVNVQFLTPFLKALVPSGINLHFRAARSVYPSGVQLG